MQKLWLVTVSLFLLIAYYLTSGEGLKCFVCRSDTNRSCTSGNMNKNYSLECPKNNGRSATVCRKIHQQLRFKNEDKFTSIRECGYDEGHLHCYFFKRIELAFQETCECPKDNCNRGSSCEPDIQMIIATFAFVIVYILKY